MICPTQLTFDDGANPQPDATPQQVRTEPMKRQRPPHDAREVVTIGGCEFLRNGGNWMFWCGCGDLVALSNVTDDKCANCNAAVSYPKDSSAGRQDSASS